MEGIHALCTCRFTSIFRLWDANEAAYHYRDERQLKRAEEEPTNASQHRPCRGYGQHFGISARRSAGCVRHSLFGPLETKYQQCAVFIIPRTRALTIIDRRSLINSNIFNVPFSSAYGQIVDPKALRRMSRGLASIQANSIVVANETNTYQQQRCAHVSEGRYQPHQAGGRAAIDSKRSSTTIAPQLCARLNLNLLHHRLLESLLPISPLQHAP